ncbi:hypothetical protein ASPZODRAFT_1210542 [Penicilliopsis zonata CBS 506.65]|uniref:sn-1-specific diacylglycerol lipase n=1 Tax=Penicilliopsis zonata CBS 506.65 TaxID=1073090 RepID=A0A1L9S7D8_9EURO|nr:hypothetical protein ASPZODRAFT_1210542 [Penicilliopsis zonata CBS 506.65]OJJ43070.1 hypothetical protein ASPZODRAFT_1210542 [Penicilliopsis zonata CBS 506.65]
MPRYGISSQIDAGAAGGLKPGCKESAMIQVDRTSGDGPASPGTTLLPRPVASLVSFVTQSTSLSLRVWSFFGGVAINSAKVTTLTGLELSRAVIEGILTRAGRDVALRNTGEDGRLEAETLLERSLAVLHTTVNSASFVAAATFNFSSTTLSSASHLSQVLLSTLDAILGSTESSRAIAAIITLIRREFRASNIGDNAENVGVGDLLVGTVGFAMLQRWGRKNTEQLMQKNGGHETVWDVVILDNGVRADVVGAYHTDHSKGSDEIGRNELKRATSFISPGDDEEAFDAVERGATVATDPSLAPHLTLPPERQHQISEEEIRSYILKQLPAGCHASITTELVTARTITVDIFDDDTAEIVAPPGTMMIEERFHHDQDNANNAILEPRPFLPKHSIVFRTAFNKLQSAEVRPEVESAGFATGGLDFEDQPGNAATSVGIRGRLSKVDQGGPEATKSPFGKGLPVKVAHKVKPGNTDRSETGKKPSPKRPSVKPVISSSTGSPISSGKSPRAPASEGQAVSRRPTTKPNSKAKRSESAQCLNEGASSPAAKRSPLHASSAPAIHLTPSKSSSSRPKSSSGRFSIHERNSESYISQTDSYSFRSADMRPGSPSATRTHRSSSSMSVTTSEADGNISLDGCRRSNSSLLNHHSTLFSPSIYSVATGGSETSLILAQRPRKSAYEDIATIQALNRNGLIPGIFPEQHFVQNIRRFCRFSSASYGSNALKVMGIRQTEKTLRFEDPDTYGHSEFSDHAGLPPSTILLSSYVDPAGGSNAAGETDSGFPLVHYLCIDHQSKAIVLTLRGTWGFEDVLTDMTCDYDDLEWQGKNWKVHKGMHASARRLLEGGGGRVMVTLRAALEEFTDYGVILCGHSLGGGVAALLATMISEPSTEATGPSFVTASFRSQSHSPQSSTRSDGLHTQNVHYFLPSGRPIHVYAYGPPAAMSPFLRRVTRGLVTTIVNGQDVVPSLSLGILHDMHTASLAFKSDISGARSHVRHRAWEALRQSIVNKFYVNQTPVLVHAGDGIGEDTWAWKALTLLRDDMRAPKLVPPGEVFVVDTMRVLQRDAFTSNASSDNYPRLGRPATRAQLKFIRDVETWFGELRFGSGMLSDHNPARYEASIAALAQGVLDD